MDAEVKVPSFENPELKINGLHLKSGEEYSQACFVTCQEFLTYSNSSASWSIQLHFRRTLSLRLTVLVSATVVCRVHRRLYRSVGHPARRHTLTVHEIPCWVPAV